MSTSTIHNVAIVTSAESWFLPYAEQLALQIAQRGFEARVYTRHEDVDADCDATFLLSYFRIVGAGWLAQRRYNMVVHESALPQGKGWAPLFWQILEGADTIPVTLFAASENVDSGDIYLVDEIVLNGSELHDEIRRKQARTTFEMCLRFLAEYPNLTGKPQQGAASIYRRRTPDDSELDPHATIDEQFRLLRIADNEAYPAFFIRNNKKYILKIYDAEQLGADENDPAL